MAIIYSYPLNDDIKSLDELVGTTEKNINGQLKTVTRNFLLQDLAEFFIVDGGLQREIILTTNGSSGVSTLNQLTGVLNIPQYDLNKVTSVSAIGLITSTGGLSPAISTSLSTNKLVGRYSASTGIFEEITLGTGLSFFGNILNASSPVTPYALTRVNDTNVTLTLGGSPNTALLQNVSLTLGWNGTLEDSRIASASIWNAKQSALNGTGFVKSTAGIITYDTNTYYLASNPNGFITYTSLSSIATGLTYNNITGVFSLSTGYSIPTITSQTSWDTAYNYRLASLTTTGTSGPATLIGNVLNIPQYSGGGSQNLQQVTDIGATTDNTITINTINKNGLNINTSGSDITKSPITVTSTIPDATTFKSLSYNGALGNYLYADTGDCASLQTDDPFGIGLNVASTGIGISAYSIDFTVVELYQALTNKGLTINSGTSSTGNFIELNKNGVDKLTINQQGELTATKLIKQGGTSSQILAADGSVITAGTNITISGGTISSVGGAGGGGSSVNYYLNGGTSQGTFGGSTYYEFSKTAVVGTGVDFNISSNGYIASFITDVADPSLLLIPGGNWNLEFYFSSSSAGGSPSFYTELYKYDGTTFTSIASNSATPEGITGGTSIDAYFTSLAVPETILTVNDRLAIRVFVNASSKTITLHTQDSHLCEVITTFTTGLTALNGLQAQVQNFATGTTGTDFSINSSGSTHTFNLPSASATARGVVTTGSQTFAGVKTFSSNPKIPVNFGNSGVGALVIENGTGQLEVATNFLYPNLIEIQNVKGVTSSIQTQFSGKQDTLVSSINIKSINGNSLLGAGNLTISATTPSQSAFTVLANNTNASAVPTEQVFKSIAEQTFPSGNITWTGTTNPSGTTAHTYTWNQIGNMVTIRLNLAYTIGGSALTSVACVLPSDLPTPALPSSVTTNLDVVSYGSGVLSTTRAALATPVATYGALRLKTLGTPNVFEIIIARASSSAQFAYAFIQYFV